MICVTCVPMNELKNVSRKKETDKLYKSAAMKMQVKMLKYNH